MRDVSRRILAFVAFHSVRAPAELIDIKKTRAGSRHKGAIVAQRVRLLCP
jgi:hypothetical protein